MKKNLKFLFAAALLCLAPIEVKAERPILIKLLPHDMAYLEEQLTRCYSDTDYAARVGICAVVLNRMESDNYPDTAAGVIESLKQIGEFTCESPPSDDSARLSHDAVIMAANGADPTGNSLNFRKIKKKLKKFGSTIKSSDRMTIGNVEFY